MVRVFSRAVFILCAAALEAPLPPLDIQRFNMLCLSCPLHFYLLVSVQQYAFPMGINAGALL